MQSVRQSREGFCFFTGSHRDSRWSNNRQERRRKMNGNIRSRFKKSVKDNRGIGTVELILILVVLIALVLIFKEQMITLVNNIFQTITSQSGRV